MPTVKPPEESVKDSLTDIERLRATLKDRVSFLQGGLPQRGQERTYMQEARYFSLVDYCL